ncbi:MAG TPA: sulfotransferase family protein [Alteromonas australica]|uniref:Sulfotransferase family protein n=2 Tax=Alteromonas australica TaxID=589873 RepID=A0A350P700_9ALTE|nr:sulfotransferase family protein [Alteromonas sp.]HAW77067.1 sulfotransferase family protein [Alteromonas australica]
MRPSKDNPNGYWEDELIVDINEKLLHSLGYQWCSLVWLNLADLRQSKLYEALRQKAVNYLQKLLAKNKKVSLKDPRMCILLPFWLDVFKELDTDIKVVLVKRHVHAIANSLLTRDQFDNEYASQLIYLHWAAIVRFLPKSYSRILINYEEVRRDEIGIRKSLMTFLDVESSVPSNLFEEKLEHHATSSSEASASGFTWQQEMLMGFPNANVDEDRIKSLATFYYALNAAYGKRKLRQYIINEIKSFADNYKTKKVILYGASEFASILIGQLSDAIVLSVDYAASEDHQIARFGKCFCAPHLIRETEHDVIVVAVTGRKDELIHFLSGYTSQPITFAEECLF